MRFVLAVLALALEFALVGFLIGGDGSSLAFLPFIGTAVAAIGRAVVGGAATKAISKAGAWVGRQVGGVARVATNNPVLTGAVGGALIPSFMPTAPPVPTPQGSSGGGYTGPREDSKIKRILQRIVPGGQTGLEWTPVNDMTDKHGNPVLLHPAMVARYEVPRGYVVVEGNDGEKYGMLRRVAVANGLWKAPPKPPISGYDARAIRRAAAATKRVKKLASKVGFTCQKKGTGRASFGSKKKARCA
jgi:hypothetical protein